MRWSDEIPLEKVVRPGDTLVIIEKPAHRHPFEEESTAEEELRVRAENADDVFVAQLKSVAPTITEKGSWATTTISADVRQILKRNSSKPKTPVGVRNIFHDGAARFPFAAA